MEFLRDSYRVAISRACRAVLLSESVYRYRSKRNPDTALRERIKEIAAARMRYGYQRIHVLLRREGWLVNHKKVHRIYKEEGLNLRSKRPRRRVAAANRLERPDLNTVDQCWSMDFVADNLFDGTRIRSLTVVDNFSSRFTLTTNPLLGSCCNPRSKTRLPDPQNPSTICPPGARRPNMPRFSHWQI